MNCKRTIQSLILAVALSIATLVPALECNNPTGTFWDDGRGHFGFEYTCDDATTTVVVRMPEGMAKETLAELFLDRECVEYPDLKDACIEFRDYFICQK